MATTATIYIDHDRIPHDALVINSNNDGSKDIAILTGDPKLLKRATSADWATCLVRITHVRSFTDKLKAVLEAENVQAAQEGRNADFTDTLLVANIPESLVASRSTLVYGKTEEDAGKVSDIVLFASEREEMPEPYRIPVKEPPPEPEAPTATQKAGEGSA